MVKIKNPELYITKDLVERVVVKRNNQNIYRVNIYGHVYEWYLDKNYPEQVLTRDGVEICRTSSFDSGLPCSRAINFTEIAGSRERSFTVAASLMGAKTWSTGKYDNPKEIKE